ncbi:hypothetical protein J6590_001647 [Homalodisca vitripennis]|nr:hypothetical protein J6590_001647 [Homalodisca vitripennis]
MKEMEDKVWRREGWYRSPKHGLARGQDTRIREMVHTEGATLSISWPASDKSPDRLPLIGLINKKQSSVACQLHILGGCGSKLQFTYLLQIALESDALTDDVDFFRMSSENMNPNSRILESVAASDSSCCTMRKDQTRDHQGYPLSSDVDVWVETTSLTEQSGAGTSQ